MEFLGVGPSELLLIVAIAIIVVGPKNMAETGKTIGSWLNRIIKSDAWMALRTASQEIQKLPTQLMIDDNMRNPSVSGDTEQQAREKRDAWTQGAARPSASSPADAPTTLIPGPEKVEAHPNTIHLSRAVTASEPAVPESAPKPASSKKKMAAAKPSSKGKKPAPAKKSGRKPAVKASRAPRKKSNA